MAFALVQDVSQKSLRCISVPPTAQRGPAFSTFHLEHSTLRTISVTHKLVQMLSASLTGPIKPQRQIKSVAQPYVDTSEQPRLLLSTSKNIFIAELCTKREFFDLQSISAGFEIIYIVYKQTELTLSRFMNLIPIGNMSTNCVRQTIAWDF